MVDEIGKIEKILRSGPRIILAWITPIIAVKLFIIFPIFHVFFGSKLPPEFIYTAFFSLVTMSLGLGAMRSYDLKQGTRK